MAAEVTVNRTDAFDIHPCFEMDNVSYILQGTPSTMCVLLYIFLGSLSVVTVCGNLLVIISIIYFKQLHTPTNSLILSLAVADLLAGLLAFPLNMEFSLTSCAYNEDLFCKVRGMFDLLLPISSNLHLCCVSFDRYYAVCQPLTYRTKINNHVVVIMILVSWGVSVLIGIGFITVEINQEKCDLTCYVYGLMANTSGIIFSYFLPMIIMLCIYLKIFLVAQRQARSIESTKSRVTVSKTERKATKTLAVVTGFFYISLFCFFSTIILGFIGVCMPLPLAELLTWFTLLNSTLNPFIYAFYYSWFRSAFKMIISGKIFQGDYTNSKLL